LQRQARHADAGKLSRAKLDAVSEPAFVPAAQLSGDFYAEVVRPLLAERPHSAALLGWGSDVLGYDTERSTDHGWGPRLLVFVDDADSVEELQDLLAAGLPKRFKGWPVRFGWDAVETTHHVTVSTVPAWLVNQLGVDATGGMSTLDWLLTPQQKLLGVVAGAVHADASGGLGSLREALSWYPDEVWRWMLACQWHRLAQEEAFVARAAEVGDETGSAVTAGRLVRDMMRLALMLDRRYAPYQKWLGSAFARARHADSLPTHLSDAVQAHDVTAREAALAGAYTALARRHNDAALTDPVEASIRNYHERPARVLMADRFTEASMATVTDPALCDMPPVGAIDQVVDSTEVLETPQSYRRLAALYTGESRQRAE
jgi:Domain of unknown function (DUF4037)